MTDPKMFWNSWEELLNKPREDVGTFCAGLFYYHALEKSKQDETSLVLSKIGDYTLLSLDCDISSTEDISRIHIQDRLFIFIYESIEADFIKNKVTKIINGEEFYECFNAYMSCYKAQTPNVEFPIPTKKYSKDEAMGIINNYIDAKENLKGYINPAELVSYLYSSIGKEFLPHSLISYYEKKNGVAQKKSMSMENSGNNRSGSKVNPEKHGKTKNACQKAWDKIQNDRTLDLNYGIFSAIATSFLEQGESLITTVSRVFYREEVSQEYKAGTGRKGK